MGFTLLRGKRKEKGGIQPPEGGKGEKSVGFTLLALGHPEVTLRDKKNAGIRHWGRAFFNFNGDQTQAPLSSRPKHIFHGNLLPQEKMRRLGHLVGFFWCDLGGEGRTPSFADGVWSRGRRKLNEKKKILRGQVTHLPQSENPGAGRDGRESSSPSLEEVTLECVQGDVSREGNSVTSLSTCLTFFSPPLKAGIQPGIALPFCPPPSFRRSRDGSKRQQTHKFAAPRPFFPPLKAGIGVLPHGKNLFRRLSWNFFAF